MTVMIAGFLFGIALSMNRQINRICNKNISNIIIIDFTKEDFLESLNIRTSDDIKRLNFYSSIKTITNIFMIVGSIIYIIALINYVRQV